MMKNIDERVRTVEAVTGATVTPPSSLELGDSPLTEQPTTTGEEICREEIEQVNPFKSGLFSSLGALLLFAAEATVAPQWRRYERSD